MSLVCHTIISRHSPENESSTEEESETNDASPFHPVRHHTRAAPSFVPATLKYDEFGMPMESFPQPNLAKPSSSEVSLWYKNLTSRAREKSPVITPTLPLYNTNLDGVKPHEKLCRSENTFQNAVSTRADWFSTRPLPSCDAVASSSTTLPDLLKRNPPPLPPEPAFTPPVFLFIGPSNKGFNMLQRKGWEEGEGLGSGRIEPKRRQGIGMNKIVEGSSRNYPGTKLSRSKLQLPTEAQNIMDLTLSDSEDGEEIIDLTLSDDDPTEETFEQLDESKHEHHGTTLITPIATTLKADRLGIGLKSRRRGTNSITHTPAAIAAHIQNSKEARKRLKERYGRGSKGFGRIQKKKEADRVKLLAYLNS